jgi:transcriptional regulator with XRE-family HTH domain
MEGYCVVMPRQTFTEQLRAAIAKSGMSQGEVARRLGVTPGLVSRFVRGEQWIGRENLDALADLLGLRVEQRAKRKRRS